MDGERYLCTLQAAAKPAGRRQDPSPTPVERHTCCNCCANLDCTMAPGSTIPARNVSSNAPELITNTGIGRLDYFLKAGSVNVASSGKDAYIFPIKCSAHHVDSMQCWQAAPCLCPVRRIVWWGTSSPCCGTTDLRGKPSSPRSWTPRKCAVPDSPHSN